MLVAAASWAVLQRLSGVSVGTGVACPLVLGGLRTTGLPPGPAPGRRGAIWVTLATASIRGFIRVQAPRLQAVGIPSHMTVAAMGAMRATTLTPG